MSGADQELNLEGSTEEQRDDTGGHRPTKQSWPCTHLKTSVIIPFPINNAHILRRQNRLLNRESILYQRVR
jgi:hypothetical protein